LVTVSWPLQSIPEGTFKDCVSLTSFTVPEGVTWIRADAFLGCSHLTTLSLPATLINIDSGAFRDCERLEEVYCHSETVPLPPYSINAEGIFENVPISRVTLHVPASALADYQATVPWNGFAY
jgi:hypothetical protein